MVVPVGAAGCQRARSQRGLTWEAVGGAHVPPPSAGAHGELEACVRLTAELPRCLHQTSSCSMSRISLVCFSDILLSVERSSGQMLAVMAHFCVSLASGFGRD